MRRFVSILILVLVLGLSSCYKPGATKEYGTSVPVSKWHGMTIGEEMAISAQAVVYRAPGGWVFRSVVSGGIAACFIPLSDEGKDKE
jgi:hypothetical protein